MLDGQCWWAISRTIWWVALLATSLSAKEHQTMSLMVTWCRSKGSWSSDIHSVSCSLFSSTTKRAIVWSRAYRGFLLTAQFGGWFCRGFPLSHWPSLLARLAIALQLTCACSGVYIPLARAALTHLIKGLDSGAPEGTFHLPNPCPKRRKRKINISSEWLDLPSSVVARFVHFLFVFQTCVLLVFFFVVRHETYHLHSLVGLFDGRGGSASAWSAGFAFGFNLCHLHHSDYVTWQFYGSLKFSLPTCFFFQKSNQQQTERQTVRLFASDIAWGRFPGSSFLVFVRSPWSQSLTGAKCCRSSSPRRASSLEQHRLWHCWRLDLWDLTKIVWSVQLRKAQNNGMWN